MSKLIKLTRPDGVAVWLMGSAVERISAVISGDGPDGARTTVNCGGIAQHVLEPPSDVIRLVEAADG